MESWSELVSSFPTNPELRDMEKALRTAETLISGNLAPFEIGKYKRSLLKIGLSEEVQAYYTTTARYMVM